MALRLRILACFLALLPVVWANCPCCLAGKGCAAPSAAQASKAAHHAPVPPACPCCARKAAESDPAAPKRGGEDSPKAPRDCEGCAASFARGGAVAAPSTIALPAFDALAVPAPVALESAPVPAAALGVPPAGPAPPGPRLESVSTVVLLI